MSQEIPVLDLTSQITLLSLDLQGAIDRVMRSGQFIMGPEVTAFEEEVAAYLEVSHAVAVNSGTDGLVIGLHALGVGPGDEVITTPFTFFATAEAISQVGATPVFVDIDPATFNIDPDGIEDKITEKTRALLPVHLYGQSADMDRLQQIAERHGLKILEDAAQAFGSEYGGRKVGTIGQAGAFSFFPSKNLGACGDGGMVVTDDDEIASVVRMLRAHGSRKKYFNEAIGYNSRLDAIQAAILRVKLPYIDKWNNQRRTAADRYDKLLEGIPSITCPPRVSGGTHVFHQYTVRVAGGRRDELRSRLSEAGVGTMVYYPVPVHKLPVYNDIKATLPHSEAAATEVLSLPIWPEISHETQKRVVENVSEVLVCKTR